MKTYFEAYDKLMPKLIAYAILSCAFQESCAINKDGGKK